MTHPKPCSEISNEIPQQRRRTRSRSWPRQPRRDPHTRLIAQLLELCGADSSVIATSSVPWASATFIGARHRIVLRLNGAKHQNQADKLSKALPDAEFSIPGHLVADACIDARYEQESGSPKTIPLQPEDRTETIFKLCFLTIEDW